MEIGGIRADLLDAGSIRLDGGAMFRVVPRPLWEPFLPPDGRNRVRLGMRPLLLRTGDTTVLVDAGAGLAMHRDARTADRLGLETGVGLEAGLLALGVAPDQVDLVVLTHLHFDHVGGLIGPGGSPRFPRAKVVVQRADLEEARSDCPLCRASYAPADLGVLEAAGLLAPIEGDAQVAPGVTAQVTGGHTRAHQLVRIEGGGRTLVCWGDLLPTRAHLQPHWVTGYDLYPVESWRAKSRLVPQAAAGGWISLLYHDPESPLGRIAADGKGWRWEPLG